MHIKSSAISPWSSASFSFALALLFATRPASAAPAAKAAVVSAQRAEEVVASANSDKYHRLTCDYAGNILEENKVYYKTPADAERDGKYACSVCRP